MKIWAIVISIFLLPSVAQAKVIISEISWMGILGDANKESIELYNTSNQDIDLSGWTLYRKDKNTFVDKDIFTLQGILSKDNYLVIERITNDEKDIFSDSHIKTKFKGGALANTGEYLILKNSLSEIVFEINNTSGWVAGNNDNKYTMQYSSNGNWITAPSTLGFKNSDKDLNPIVKEDKKEDKKIVNEEKDSFLKIYSEKDIYQNIPALFSVEGAISNNQKGTFIWNMGDGTYIENKKLSNIKHVYKNTGIYTINAALVDKRGEVIIKDSLSISIKVFDLEIEKIDTNHLKIKNKTSTKIDLSKIKIVNGSTYLNIPKFTELSSKAEVVLELKDQIGDSLDIYTENGIFLYSQNFIKEVTPINTVVKNSKVSNIKNDIIQTIPNIESKKIEILDINKDQDSKNSKQKSHTSKIFIGMTIFVVIGLFLLLERFMTQKE